MIVLAQSDTSMPREPLNQQTDDYHRRVVEYQRNVADYRRYLNRIRSQQDAAIRCDVWPQGTRATYINPRIAFYNKALAKALIAAWR